MCVQRLFLVFIFIVNPGAIFADESADWRDVEIILPPGFTATVFHPGLGNARHVAVREATRVYGHGLSSGTG